MSDRTPSAPPVDSYDGFPVLWSVVAVDEGDGRPSVKVNVRDTFLEEMPSIVRTYTLGKSLRNVADLLIENAVAADREEEAW